MKILIADNSKLINLYKYKFTNIEDGITASVLWCKDNFTSCRK